METINDRIELIVNQYFNGSKTAFANAMGMPPTMMSSYLGKARRSKPSIDMVAKIITTLPVDAKWLIIGEPSANVSTQGDNSPASVHGDVVNNVGDNAVLQERVKSLEALLAEKERLIQVYERMAEK